MSHSGSVDSETDEPGPDANTRHVYCAVLDRVLPGTEALHHLQSGVPGGRVSDLQQRAGKLHLLEQLRRSPVREWLRPRPSCGDDDGAEDGEERGGTNCVTTICICYCEHVRPKQQSADLL